MVKNDNTDNEYGEIYTTKIKWHHNWIEELVLALVLVVAVVIVVKVERWL